MTPGHEMIMASAGSGKTYALTNRYVQLLALGAPPERIVALTFTRKAAGEFFDEILTKLARAAADPAYAATLARDLGLGALAPEKFCALLRGVIDTMPRLALGTFDAFFSRVVRSFPLELGLGGDFTLLEEYAAQFERRRVMRALFAHTGREPDEAQREFIESFKRATFGHEEKRLSRLLDGFIDDHHRDFLAAPDAAAWGDPARIWPAGAPWCEVPDLAPAGATLRAWVATAPIADKQRGRWLAFLDALETYAPGVNPPRELLYVLEKILATWPAIARGDAVLEFDRKKQDLSVAACGALQAIARNLFAREYSRRMSVTRGVHGVLARYDAGYETLVRRAGRLTFSDVERLLRGVAIVSHPPVAGLGEAGAEVADPGDNTASHRRLLLDWRLDGQFDHWLLDEFQDTSRGQWQVLHNLIDEVVQDASRARTFFCVGDVKQAIYGWRGGDTRLFREILDHYNAAGPAPAIKLTPMNQSWRSGPAILELVNRVFGDAPALAELSAAAGARWSRDWQAHTSAVPGNHGQAAWLHAADEAERFRRTFELLEEIDPLARGLSVAVLTQKNDTATRLADFLRREGRISAVAEADLHVCTDNPATAAVLALFKAAAHPGDTLARAHAGMTPLHAALVAENLATPEALTERMLRQVHADGFEATVEWWWRRLEPRLAADDAFSHGRGRQLVEAARRFDDTGSRDVAEFLQFADRHVVRDTEGTGVVRVMTVHKAKGLGFDVVILPDLEGRKLATRRDGLAVHRGDDHAVEWVLDLPTKFFREQDATLMAHVNAEEADACYEKIAVLYVALTRAKRAMYLISSPGTDSESRNFPRLLAATLGDDPVDVTVGALRSPGAFSVGDPQWFASLRPAPPAPPIPPPVTLAPERLSPADRRTARTPSDERAGTVSGALLFAPERPVAAEFGTAVHTALGAVEWWQTGMAGAWTTRLRALGVAEAAITMARHCLDAPALASVFQPPAAGKVEVWCERSFEIVHDGVWVTGRFDRVLVQRDAGRPARVRVIDFKTDHVATDPAALQAAAERHRPAMTWYRRAAAVLAGTSEAHVTVEIVFTAARDAAGLVAAPVVLT